MSRHGACRRGGRTTEHAIWTMMLQRTTNPKCRMFPDYGGRGISVCERWRSFEAFLADMGPRPSSGHSLDRIDVNGNYEPGNVRWATRHEQARNTRRNVFVEVNGETLCLKDACEKLGINYSVARRRMSKGQPWDVHHGTGGWHSWRANRAAHGANGGIR